MLTDKFGPLIDAENLRSQGYGLEAIKRLRAGRPIVYSIGEIIVEEHPDGRRYEMTLDEHDKPMRVRELHPRPSSVR